MALTFEQAEAAVMQLDAEQRELLALKVLSELDGTRDTEPAPTAEQLAEWHRRSAESDKDPSRLISGEVWAKKWREKLGL